MICVRLALVASIAWFAVLASDEDASGTLVNRRVLESEFGFENVVKNLKAYEVHNFGAHKSTRRLLESAGQKSLTYELNVLGRRTLFELERDDALFVKGYKHYIVGENDQVERIEGARDCIYKGTSSDDKLLAATVSLCDGLVHVHVHHYDPNKAFSVQPLQMSQGSEHVAYHHRDLIDSGRSCDGGQHPHFERAKDDDKPMLRRLDPTSSQARHLDSNVKVIGVSVVNDFRRFQMKGQGVHLHSAFLMTVANSLFSLIGNTDPNTGGRADYASAYQYRLEIVSMYTFSVKDPWNHTAGSASVDNVPLTPGDEVEATHTLEAFENWRKFNLKPTQTDVVTTGADIAHLLTGFTFDGSLVGLAHVGGLCNVNQRSGITQAKDLSDSQIASAITHQIGHNLGSDHTSTPPAGVTPACTDGADTFYIMSASSPAGVTHTKWENCSIEYFKRFFDSTGATPFRYSTNKCAESTADPSGTPVWNGNSVCGDGLTEGDEECDCLNNDCTNVDSCCNGATCTFTATAVCSQLDACCQVTGLVCTPKASSFVCRAADPNGCDIEETCNGTPGKCPVDAFEPTGTVCALGEPYNVAGTCHNKQCLDQKKECTERGLLNTPDHRWTQTCRNENSDNTCIIYCTASQSPPTGCAGFQPDQFFADGTQCATGKGCFQGACVPFDSVVVLNNANCTNNVIDQNETDLDCGGPACLGCAAGQLCAADKDCILGNCNKTVVQNANGYTNLGKCSATGPVGGGESNPDDPTGTPSPATNPQNSASSYRNGFSSAHLMVLFLCGMLQF